MAKKSLAATAFAASLLLSIIAAAADSATADGEVKKIDKTTNKMTIRHGPIKAFDMEDPMTMVYRVKDPAMLNSVKVGDKVKFEADRADGQFTVIKIEKAK